MAQLSDKVVIIESDINKDIRGMNIREESKIALNIVYYKPAHIKGELRVSPTLDLYAKSLSTIKIRALNALGEGDIIERIEEHDIVTPQVYSVLKQEG